MTKRQKWLSENEKVAKMTLVYADEVGMESTV